jgi:hypothetical protein
VLPRLIGRDIDLTKVRAITDLARLEDWEDIYFAVLAELQDKTPHRGVTSGESMRRIVSNKLAALSPYLVLIGLFGRPDPVRPCVCAPADPHTTILA